MKLLKKAKQTYENKDKKIRLYGKFKGQLNHKIELVIWDDLGNHIEEKGDYVVEEALKTPITKERIGEQISKLGNTPYKLDKLEIQLDQGVSIPIGQINNLRRSVIEKINGLRQNHNHRENIDLEVFNKKAEIWLKNKKGIKQEHIGLRVYVNNIIQLKAVLKFSVDRIYYSDITTIDKALKIAKSYNIQLFLAFSRITEDEELIRIKEKMDTLEDIKGIMVSNLGILNIMKDFKDINIITDFSLNVFNNGSIECLGEMNVDEITLSSELTLKQSKDIIIQSKLPCEVIIHGNLPLMISKYCPASTILKDGQNHCNVCIDHQFGLKDPLGMIFPIVRDENCKVQILNSQKLCLIESIKELIDGGIRNMRIQFTTEDTKEIVETLKAYMDTIKNVSEGTRQQSQETKDFIKKMKEQGFTKGHFFRGVM